MHVTGPCNNSGNGDEKIPPSRLLPTNRGSRRSVEAVLFHPPKENLPLLNELFLQCGVCLGHFVVDDVKLAI